MTSKRELGIYYANTPMQYTAIFHCCKNVNFQMKNFNHFLIFILLRTYTEAVLTSTHNLCFRAKIRKKYTPLHPSFTIYKWGARGSSLHGHVCMVKFNSAYFISNVSQTHLHAHVYER